VRGPHARFCERKVLRKLFLRITYSICDFKSLYNEKYFFILKIIKRGELQNIKFNFEKYKSQVVENQTAIIGYIKNGEMMKGEEFKNLYGEYNLTIDEMENITYKLDRGAKINVIISP